MKLWIWSDIHSEGQKVSFPVSAPEGVDAIICAGDLCRAADLADVASMIIERYGLPMVFVPGNHEFYRGRGLGGAASVEVCRALMAEAAESSNDWSARLYVLDDSSLVLDGVRFLGSTLWTDFELGADSQADLPWKMNEALLMMPDFGNILMEGGRKMAPQDMLDMHRTSREYLTGEIAIPFDGPTVVVTHHLPHPVATPKVHLESPANFLYASSEAAFGPVMEDSGAPCLWVCGHTHHAVDAMAGRTRILCNPYGYRAATDERENGFSWGTLAEV